MKVGVAKVSGSVTAPRLKRPSAYHGVRHVPYSARWQAIVIANGRQYILGVFTTDVAAARAFDDFMLAYGADPEELNFPHRARRRFHAHD